MAYLAQALKKNRTLRVLNLSDNNIDMGGLIAVAEALKYNTTLETLDMSHNPCSGPGLEGVSRYCVGHLPRVALTRAADLDPPHGLCSQHTAQAPLPQRHRPFVRGRHLSGRVPARLEAPASRPRPELRRHCGRDGARRRRQAQQEHPLPRHRDPCAYALARSYTVADPLLPSSQTTRTSPVSAATL